VLSVTAAGPAQHHLRASRRYADAAAAPDVNFVTSAVGLGAAASSLLSLILNDLYSETKDDQKHDLPLV
jgi:hypothetical protein